MAKLIILAALSLGVVGISSAFPQWLGSQPCAEASCLIGP
jgi:hypothetical protein